QLRPSIPVRERRGTTDELGIGPKPQLCSADKTSQHNNTLSLPPPSLSDYTIPINGCAKMKCGCGGVGERSIDSDPQVHSLSQVKVQADMTLKDLTQRACERRAGFTHTKQKINPMPVVGLLSISTNDSCSRWPGKLAVRAPSPPRPPTGLASSSILRLVVVLSIHCSSAVSSLLSSQSTLFVPLLVIPSSPPLLILSPPRLSLTWSPPHLSPLWTSLFLLLLVLLLILVFSLVFLLSLALSSSQSFCAAPAVSHVLPAASYCEADGLETDPLPIPSPVTTPVERRQHLEGLMRRSLSTSYFWRRFIMFLCRREAAASSCCCNHFIDATRTNRL
ncbi:unnamed protein product, partial [Pleuronectes platessa]